MKQEILKAWSYKNGTVCCIKQYTYPEEIRKEMTSSLIRTQWACGYVALPGLLLEITDDFSLANQSLFNVLVHGGITYYAHEEGAWVFGFDTNHMDDRHNKNVSNLEWLIEETERMTDQIIKIYNYIGFLQMN